MITDEISKQYDRYPYPHYSFFTKLDKLASVHATFEAGSALVNKKLINHDQKRIALLGCGTFEPYALGTLHPRAEVTAVDLSSQALKTARRRCALHITRNVRFERGDVREFCLKNPAAFDYIHSFGVLHHLEDCGAGFKAVAGALKPGGFARIMVYSAVSRRRLTELRGTLRLLGAKWGAEADTGLARKLIRCLPKDHPLRLTYKMNGDHGFESGIVDSLFHVRDNAYESPALLKTLDDAGLEISAWDFSQNVWNLLDRAEGPTLEEKIRGLEAFDQWPASFCFWARRKDGVEAREPAASLRLAAHPSLGIRLKAGQVIRSTLLRTNLTLTPEHVGILKAALAKNAKADEFRRQDSSRAALKELLRARLVLEVAP